MAKYRVVCLETVSTSFYVEADSKEDLQQWLDHCYVNGGGAVDIVSNKTNQQSVQDRDFVIMGECTDDRFPVEHIVKRGDFECAEKKEKS